ncbi:hypothetical protein [Deinococcus sp. JMULE3]|uniref:hypothetical protein n=1 Tax=Deinococcus sp. JMULE3 TaxID=2518341 RepID=UPI0015758A09|nr:hypothetical protein [Deinococcus sp. JMULE3]NTY01754.1 hypothetical protein [Deinococcus sp. JMULE3]
MTHTARLLLTTLSLLGTAHAQPTTLLLERPGVTITTLQPFDPDTSGPLTGFVLRFQGVSLTQRQWRLDPRNTFAEQRDVDNDGRPELLLTSKQADVMSEISDLTRVLTVANGVIREIPQPDLRAAASYGKLVQVGPGRLVVNGQSLLPGSLNPEVRGWLTRNAPAALKATPRLGAAQRVMSPDGEKRSERTERVTVDLAGHIVGYLYTTLTLQGSAAKGQYRVTQVRFEAYEIERG